MDNPQPTVFEKELAASLSRGRTLAVPGFAERVVGAVRAERRRRVVIRWSSVTTAAAACFVAVLTLSTPSEEALNREALALVAGDESATFTVLLSAGSDLALLSPAVEKSSVVELFNLPGF
jgi:hypothetical protein